MAVRIFIALAVSINAVIIDSARQVKEVIIDPNIIPDIAVDDASVMLDIPASVTAATGMDALTHAIEARTVRSARVYAYISSAERSGVTPKRLPSAISSSRVMVCFIPPME